MIGAGTKIDLACKQAANAQARVHRNVKHVLDWYIFWMEFQCIALYGTWVGQYKALLPALLDAFCGRVSIKFSFLTLRFCLLPSHAAEVLIELPSAAIPNCLTKHDKKARIIIRHGKTIIFSFWSNNLKFRHRQRKMPRWCAFRLKNQQGKK